MPYPITKKAFKEGEEAGIFFGGAYCRGMNPYTSYWPGVIKHSSWRKGYIRGAKSKPDNQPNAGGPLTAAR